MALVIKHAGEFVHVDLTFDYWGPAIPNLWLSSVVGRGLGAGWVEFSDTKTGMQFALPDTPVTTNYGISFQLPIKDTTRIAVDNNIFYGIWRDNAAYVAGLMPLAYNIIESAVTTVLYNPLFSAFAYRIS